MTKADDITAQIRSRIRSEFEGGFPLLMPVPQTGIVQLIDYANSLGAAAKDDLVSAVAEGTFAILQGDSRSFGHGGAYDRFYDCIRAPGPFTAGPRYLPVKFLSAKQSSGQPGHWAPPRPDLLPDPSALVLPTAGTLKPRVAEAMTKAGFTARKGPAASLRFLSPAGVLVDFDLGARVDQMRYGVAVNAAALADAPLGRVRFLSAEILFGGVGTGWDYLTAENAPRSISHLPTLIEAAADILRLVD